MLLLLLLLATVRHAQAATLLMMLLTTDGRLAGVELLSCRSSCKEVEADSQERKLSVGGGVRELSHKSKRNESNAVVMRHGTE